MNRFNYYVGILPKDTETFMCAISTLNESDDVNLHVSIVGEFDDPNGYYSYTIKGTWESYRTFLNEESHNPKFVKSLEHFEE